MDIQTQNKLISEFMGYTYHKSKHSYDKSLFGEGFWSKPGCKMADLIFDHDWNELIPVVEKIESLAIDNVGEIGIWIEPIRCLIGSDYHHPIIEVAVDMCHSKIEMIYKAVIQFIQWYNNQNK